LSCVERQEATFLLFSAVPPPVAGPEGQIRVILHATTWKACLKDKPEEVFS